MEHEKTSGLTAIAIRHVAHEDLGDFRVPLREAGYHVEYREAAKDTLDDATVRQVALLIVLGGPMGVYEQSKYPFLAAELRLIEARLARGLPTLGLCLGAQLVAAAAGARVYPGDGFELGFAPVTLTSEGLASPLAPLADGVPVLHWHGDTYDLPRDAVRLASTPAYPEQAFAIGTHTLALQFHPEAGGDGFEDWLSNGAADIARAGADAYTLREQAREVRAARERTSAEVLTRWLAELRLEPAL